MTEWKDIATAPKEKRCSGNCHCPRCMTEFHQWLRTRPETNHDR